MARNRQVTEAGNVSEYPAVEDMSTSMGEMLSCMHWIAGCTWSVMGGASFSVVSMNMIDFKQVGCYPKRWCHSITHSPSQDAALVEEKVRYRWTYRGIINDPYVRPRPEDPLYWSLSGLHGCVSRSSKKQLRLLKVLSVQLKQSKLNASPRVSCTFWQVTSYIQTCILLI